MLLIGDVALAHDIGGLLAASRLGLKLTIVLLDNGGGGIFDFLAVSRSARAAEPAGGRQDIYTRHIATPTGLTSPARPRCTASSTSAVTTERLPRGPGARARAGALPHRRSAHERGAQRGVHGRAMWERCWRRALSR